MNENRILVKNEYEANRFAAKVMLFTIIFVALVYLLDVVGIFVVPIITMTIALSVGVVLLLIPSVIVFILKAQGWWVKYVTVSAATLMVAFVSAFLSFHAILMYVYAIAIASLYFSRRLSWFAVVFSIIFISLGQIMGFYTNGVPDKNFTDMFGTVIYGVLPRAIELFAISLIFIALSKRTKNMLENVMGAEDQKAMLDRTLAITNKSYEVSSVLAESVKQLSDITEHTTKTNEQIAENTGKIAAGSEDTLKFVDEAVDEVSNISKNLNKIAEEGSFIADISSQVNQMTQNNGLIIRDAADEMRAIDSATGESKELIHRLGERSNEIGRIVEVIKGISGQTNLLALNAAIESARAGEQGKGFAVVAGEIRTLAEQSERAAKDISNLIKEVLEDTQKAVESMDKGSKMVGRGLEVINEADRSFERVSAASMELNNKVQEVSGVTLNVARGSDRIVDIVRNIRDINYRNLGELQSIAAASEEQLASMQQVASSVETIEKTAGELLGVVKGNNA